MIKLIIETLQTFWNPEFRATYEDLKQLFGYFGGYIQTHSGSHFKMCLPNQQGQPLATNGFFRVHGQDAARYNFQQMRILREKLTYFGITPDQVRLVGR